MYIGFIVVTIIPASHPPKATIGNSIEFERQSAIVSFGCRLRDVRSLIAKARH